MARFIWSGFYLISIQETHRFRWIVFYILISKNNKIILKISRDYKLLRTFFGDGLNYIIYIYIFLPARKDQPFQINKVKIPKTIPCSNAEERHPQHILQQGQFFIFFFFIFSKSISLLNTFLHKRVNMSKQLIFLEKL